MKMPTAILSKAFYDYTDRASLSSFSLNWSSDQALILHPVIKIQHTPGRLNGMNSFSKADYTFYAMNYILSLSGEGWRTADLRHAQIFRIPPSTFTRSPTKAPKVLLQMFPNDPPSALRCSSSKDLNIQGLSSLTHRKW